MQLESLYQEIILDHYRRPHGKGLREPYDAEVHHVNPLCGDEVTLRVSVKDAGGEPTVADISYDALGCSISQASASVMTDLVVGKTVDEAVAISGEFSARGRRMINVVPWPTADSISMVFWTAGRAIIRA